MFISDLMRTEPAYETGVASWWIAQSLTDWAQQESITGIRLPNIVAYLVKLKIDNKLSYILVDNEKREVIYESHNYEQVAVHIDMLKVLKQK